MWAIPFKYDVIIVGAGHAGCEATSACCRMGCDVLLITADIDRIGQLSCNPAMGGLAKGQLIKEVDALGGVIGWMSDSAAIQYRLLNTRKGPAVRSSRAQIDMKRYADTAAAMIQSLSAHIVHDMVEEVVTEQGRVCGVQTAGGVFYAAKSVIITTGTFLKGVCHVGMTSFDGGRLGETSSVKLSTSLSRLGLQLGRLKTGTTPRLDGRSIDFDQAIEQIGDEQPKRFSFYHDVPLLPQRNCHITHTNVATHDIIRQAVDRSPLFCGVIKGIGPRYCPSIEDKVMRFEAAEKHQIFLEPQGLDSVEIYPSGLSTSLPLDVQYAFLRTIPGLQNVRIIRPGYAVEYDFVFPTQLYPWLETKIVAGLFMAGQINGTSGYEEAAAQGFMAGINAVKRLRQEEPVVLGRDQAYIGVLIDDLVTLGTEEPYRMFTSRAEFRLLLREDNADLRLSPIGAELGLLDGQSVQKFETKAAEIKKLSGLLSEFRIDPNQQTNTKVMACGINPITKSTTVAQLLRRPELSLARLQPLFSNSDLTSFPQEVIEQVEIAIKYEGYIQRQVTQAERFQTLEKKKIPQTFDYHEVSGLSNEVCEKLSVIRPNNLGQASRISGVTPAAISILMIHLKRLGGNT